MDADLDGLLDLVVANGHIDETVRNIRGNVGYAQAPQLFLNQGGNGKFRDVAGELGGGFDAPKVGRGLAYGDFDRDGDLDLLLTTNHGPAYLYRNDQTAGNRSMRFRLVGTKSNRDAIGAVVRVFYEGVTQTRVVRGGSSYLSQSELPVTFGVGERDKSRAGRRSIGRAGGREEFKSVADWKATTNALKVKDLAKSNELVLLHYCQRFREFFIKGSTNTSLPARSTPPGGTPSNLRPDAHPSGR